MSAPEKVHALTRTDLFAAYGYDEVLLPVVAVDELGRSLVLDKRGDLRRATTVRPKDLPFDCIVIR